MQRQAAAIPFSRPPALPISGPPPPLFQPQPIYNRPSLPIIIEPYHHHRPSIDIVLPIGKNNFVIMIIVMFVIFVFVLIILIAFSSSTPKA